MTKSESMTDINDARVGDIYVDEGGTLWRVTGTCREPTVWVEAVEPSGWLPGPEDCIDVTTGRPMGGTFLRKRQDGGISGLIWRGFRRIHSVDGR